MLVVVGHDIWLHHHLPAFSLPPADGHHSLGLVNSLPAIGPAQQECRHWQEAICNYRCLTAVPCLSHVVIGTRGVAARRSQQLVSHLPPALSLKIGKDTACAH